MQGGQAAGRGDRVATQGAGLIHRAQRGQVLHDGAWPPKSRQRHAASNDLAQHRDVGAETRQGLGIQALGAAQCNTKTGHDFVKHQQCTVLCAEFSTTLDERNLSADKVHVASDRLDHQAGNVGTVQRKGLFQLGEVVVLEHQGVLHHFGRHPRAGGVAKRGQARSGFHEQCVGVTVVTAFELDQLATTGGAACESDGGHGRLSSRADQSHHVHGRNVREDGLGEFDFTLGGGAK